MILNTWLPVDIENPIPKPTNERQVLCIYRPDHDTSFNRAHGLSPFSKGPAKPSVTCDPDEDHNKYLYWDHGWMQPLSSHVMQGLKEPMIYDQEYFKNCMYCITEFPPLPENINPK